MRAEQLAPPFRRAHGAAGRTESGPREDLSIGEAPQVKVNHIKVSRLEDKSKQQPHATYSV